MCWFTSSLFVDSVLGTTILMPSSSGDQSMMEMVEIRLGLMFMWRTEFEDGIVVTPLLLISVLVIVSTEFDCVFVAAIPVSEWLLRDLRPYASLNCSSEEYANLKVSFILTKPAVYLIYQMSMVP